MSKVLVEEGNLTNIANAIRTKGNTTAVYKPGEMAAAISNLSTSTSTYVPTDEDLTFTGKQAESLFENGKFSWVLEHYTSQLQFNNIESANQCFYELNSNADLTNLTFYMSNSNYNKIKSMFAYSNLSHLPHIVGKIKDCSYLFNQNKTESIPDDFFDDFIFPEESITCNGIFSGCYNLTGIPSLEAFKQLTSKPIPSSYNSFYRALFSGCTSLQEIRDVPIVYGINSSVNKNFFYAIVDNTYKSSSFTFESNQTARFSNQELDFSSIGYNKYVQSQKDSVYNHDSAVETINSLPDTSAFLAEAGGTNTITFYRDQGANTEGGAIGNLTAEEIAIAAAKGWTVAFYD